MTVAPGSSQAPAVLPDAGWTSCQPFPRPGTLLSFLSGGPTGARLRVAYFRRDDDRRLVGRAWFGPETEGPPGHAHGGSIAAVLDEALGAAAWAAGQAVVVASLTVEFRRMVPLGTDATFETWLESIEGRKIRTRATLTDPEGRLLAEGRALCVTLAGQQAAELEERAGQHAEGAGD